MAHVSDDKQGQISRYLPDRPYKWTGEESSLRLMNTVFKPVMQLTQVLQDSQPDQMNPVPLKEIITQALV